MQVFDYLQKLMWLKPFVFRTKFTHDTELYNNSNLRTQIMSKQQS